MVYRECLVRMQPWFAPVRPSLAPVQQGFGPHAPKHLMHPLLTTLGTLEVSDPCSRHSETQAWAPKGSQNSAEPLAFWRSWTVLRNVSHIVKSPSKKGSAEIWEPSQAFQALQILLPLLPVYNPRNLEPICLFFWGCVVFGIEMSFLWYGGGLSLLFGIEISFWYQDSALCCSASRSSSSRDQPMRAFWASSSCKLEVKKISIPKRRSKNRDTPKRHLDANF